MMNTESERERGPTEIDIQPPAVPFGETTPIVHLPILSDDTEENLRTQGVKRDEAEEKTEQKKRGRKSLKEDRTVEE